MKAPQERKTPKKIERLNGSGHPNIVLNGNETSLYVGEILEDGRGAATFRGPDQIRILRDYAQAWLDHYGEE